MRGDFNTILTEKDKKGGSGANHPKSTKIINEYAEQNNLVDIWRCMNPDGFRYTWMRSNPHLIMERLDYFLIASSLDFRPKFYKTEAPEWQFRPVTIWAPPPLIKSWIRP